MSLPLKWEIAPESRTTRKLFRSRSPLEDSNPVSAEPGRQDVHESGLLDSQSESTAWLL